jgi:hypothetical protein
VQAACATRRLFRGRVCAPLQQQLDDVCFAGMGCQVQRRVAILRKCQAGVAKPRQHTRISRCASALMAPPYAQATHNHRSLDIRAAVEQHSGGGHVAVPCGTVKRRVAQLSEHTAAV